MKSMRIALHSLGQNIPFRPAFGSLSDAHLRFHVHLTLIICSFLQFVFDIMGHFPDLVPVSLLHTQNCTSGSSAT